MPTSDMRFTVCPKSQTEAPVVRTMESVVEKFFMIVSAYLITTAISSPPSALLITAAQTVGVYPVKKLGPWVRSGACCIEHRDQKWPEPEMLAGVGNL